jgi:hypothetical protein
MTLFMLFTMATYLAIVAMLWCFRGFTREIKRGRRVIGLLVRVERQDSPGPGPRRAMLVALKPQTSVRAAKECTRFPRAV